MTVFGPSPREEPLTYPGRSPRESGLVTGTGFLPFERLRVRRLAQARVILGPDRPPVLEPYGSRATLGFVLLMVNAVPIEARIPVLAVGSNAAPAQMLHKFQSAGISPVMPLTWAEVTGVRVGVAATVSRWGYVPAAPVFEPAATARLAVNWLDPEQLAALDETEVGYERRRLVDGGADTAVCLGSGERLAGCGIYMARRGVLAARGDRRPLDMPPSQQELIGRLLTASPALRRLARDVDGFVAAAADDGLRPRVRAALRDPEAFGVVPYAAGPTQAGDPETYGAARAGLPGPEDVDGALRVAPSPDEVARRGEATVVVPTDTWEALGRPSHVVVRSCMDPGAPRAVGRAVHDGTGGEVLVDQALRNGVGVEIGEYVTLEAAAIEQHGFVGSPLGIPNSLLCRVQQAELVTSERRAALLNRLALELIGVESGDRVVIEGLPPAPGEPVAVTTVKAFEAPDDTVQRREAVSGGSQHRFPSARDALGVHPDLPWIFIDRALRSQLRLSGEPLAVVRVRASRRDQLTKELRELLLLVVLAIVGLVEAVHGRAVAGLLLAGAAVVVATVVFRLRARLRED